ncbi:IS66 family insertion sequence element accessory protein TnpB [Dubosiella newyorkensis]
MLSRTVYFFFCGRKTSSIKGILWEEDGFLLLCSVLTKEKSQWLEQ